MHITNVYTILFILPFYQSLSELNFERTNILLRQSDITLLTNKG